MTAETVSAALAEAAQLLAKTSETPRLDAEMLLAHALGVEREPLLLVHMRDIVPASFESLLNRRLNREPIAYIVGWRDFWDIRLKVGPGALIPRPDSETLLEAAQAHFASSSPKAILDLGTGPGTLVLAALSVWPSANGVGIDASDSSLSYAKENARVLGMAGRVQLTLGNWCEGVSRKFDLILCNPPYVEMDADLASDVADYEPHSALFAGADGLDDYRLIVPQLPILLNRDGLICLEIGYQQAVPVQAMFAEVGMQSYVRQDLSGRNRCICATF